MPLLNLPLRVNGLLLSAIFFTIDIVGGRNQFIGELDSNTAYWAHVGGYIGGITLGYWLKLYKDALTEAKEYKAETLSKSDLDKENAIKSYEEILQNDKYKALTYMLKLKKYNDQEQSQYFIQLMELYVNSGDFSSADELYFNYPRQIKVLPTHILMILGSHFFRMCSFQEARKCLEFTIQHEGPWQAKAFMLLADTYENIGNKQRVSQLLYEVTRRYPDDSFGAEAQRRLKILNAEI
jgi:tetratricopeptide (TPR) repeat protein